MKVTLTKSERVFTWDSEAENLLEFLEDQDIFPDNSCRGGMCQTCMTRLLSGSITYVIDPSVQIDTDHVLLCSARPASDITLDL